MRRLFICTLILLAIRISFGAEVGININSSVYIGNQNGNIEYDLLSSRVIFSSELSKGVKIFSSILFRLSLSAREVENISPWLKEIVYSDPSLFDIYECYLSLDGVGAEFISVTIGKQRIAWGKADKINPTDILNPFDLHSIVEFSEKFPSWLFNAKFFIPLFEESYIQLVLSPFFASSKINSVIASKYASKVQEEVLDRTKGFGFSRITLKAVPFGDLERIPLNVTNSLAGIRIGTRVVGFDISMSFVTRANDLPFIRRVIVSNELEAIVKSTFPLVVETNLSIESVYYYLGYHRETMIGFDLSKDFGPLVGWAEVGIFFPEEVERKYEVPIRAITIISTNPPLTNTNYFHTSHSETYLKEGYVKYVFGLDKTFEGGWYINIQFAHGLGIERGFSEERLQDYLTLNVEKKFLEDTLKTRLYTLINIDGVFERFKESNIWEALISNSGILGGLEISYYPVIGTKVYLNIMGIDGNGETMLSKLEEFDLVSIGFSMEL